MKIPIFEIRYQNRETFKIYETGEIEGFPEGAMICNRIPPRIAQECSKASLASTCPSNKVASKKT